MPRDTIKIVGDFSPFKRVLVELGLVDYSEPMERIKQKYMHTLSRRAWSGSGLKSISGELKQGMTPWSGKVSTGVGLRTKRGRDKVLPKAVLHTYGAKKGSYTGKKKRVTPWGDVPARPFMPQSIPTPYVSGIENIITDFVNDRFARPG